jgi:eukaryotic-like serine/threonine-protein kinase
LPGAERYPGQDDYSGNTKRNTAWILAFLITLLVASGLAYALIKSNEKPKEQEPEAKKEVQTPVIKQPAQNVPIGQYRVVADKTYFHNEPDASTRRNAFLSKTDPVTAYDDQNGFVYTEFTNSRGQTSKGWLRKSDLLTADEWAAQKQQQDQNRRPTQDEIKTQLTLAAGYVRTNQLEDALTIYNFLAPFDVPEAQYHAANFALQGKNPSVACNQALAWLNKASDAGYLLAKRTLGVLYLFAENPAWLQINNYNACTYTKDLSKARDLLSQAANGGDTTARQLLDELKLNHPQ